MRGPPSFTEREGGEPAIGTPHLAAPRDRRVQIVSRPVSLRFFVLCGLVIFALGFWHGRQLAELDGAAIAATEPAASPTPTALATKGAPPAASSAAEGTPSQSGQPTVVTVTIRLLKFAPQQIELKAGDTVEWKNADITPHTATAENKDFDSGSINANASWRYTFTHQGTFPYICTFHPEMKGVVVVR